jgi:hypothetical protein
MKKTFLILPLLLLLLTSCAYLGTFGKSSNQVAKAQTKISSIEGSISNVRENKMDVISQLSFGTDYALNKSTNKEPAIITAKELNKRVQSIAGLPDIEKQTAMVQLVNDLISSNINSQVELSKMDNNIQALQSEESILLKSKQKEVDKAMELSKQVALENDTTQSKLNDLNKYWGLASVFYGIKTFITHSLWALGIFLIVFIILRALAASNPIANVLFGIFQQLAASAIHLIEIAIPNSISIITQAEKDVAKVSNIVAQVNSTPTTNATTVTEHK